MTVQVYSADQLTISYADLVALRRDMRVSLGISDRLAQRISLDRRIAPKRTTARAAYLLWDWVGLGLFGYSIYASFAYHWWWFLVGFVVMGLLHRSNRSGNTANIIEAAYYDEDFYERIAEIGGWAYQMSPDVAVAYMR